MSYDNMPPGVSTNDIPGNRPEDIADEEFWETVWDKAIALGLSTPDVGPQDTALKQLIEFVRITVSAAAFNEGRAEGHLDVYERWEAVDRARWEAEQQQAQRSATPDSPDNA